MKMRIRLFLSLLGVALAIGSMLVLTALGNFEDYHHFTISHAKTTIDTLTQANLEFAEETLTEFGEHYVELMAESTAKELSPYFKGISPRDYTLLRKDNNLRSKAIQRIQLHGNNVGYTDVFDITTETVFHPDPGIEGHRLSFWKEKYPQMWALVTRSLETRAVSGYYDFIDDQGRTRPRYLSIVRIPETTYRVVAVVNIDQFFIPVRERIQAFANMAKEEALTRIETSAQKEIDEDKSFFLMEFAGSMILCGLLAMWLAGGLSAPIRRLTSAVEEVGKGDFSQTIPIEGSYETRRLAHSFMQMETDLAKLVEQVREEAQTRQAIESEMHIARQIQESLLPRSFPPFPDNREFDLHAVNLPAKEVAGDFYDFFFINEQTLVVIMADVSDKGMAAALYMAVTRTLFRTVCMEEDDPAKAVERVNRVLSMDNEACMFVTTVLGYYDISTGTLRYINAGHELCLTVSCDEKPELFGHVGDPALGIIEDATFKEQEYTLQPGQTLVLFTDGVTEAFSPTNEAFGRERFVNLANHEAGNSVLGLCSGMADVVVAFQNNKLSDDITILALRRT